MSKFKAGYSYSCRSICDYNCIWTFKVVKRTDKTIFLVKDGKEEPFRCKIHLDEEGKEFCYPLGRYSMAPILRVRK